jgi:S-methylmethionine-dependent homocysteine/selenocysteine methylase
MPARYRERLPQLDGGVFMTDGGMETTLIFKQDVELPEFAAFPLAGTPEGRAALRAYYAPYVTLANELGVGLIVDTPTWRASSDWAGKLGFTSDELADLIRDAVVLVDELRAAAEPGAPFVISGCVGPRGDGYNPAELMTADEAERYHRAQVVTFGETAVDLVSAITMTSAAEAIGIVRAAREVGLPVVISFTVETDGRLPSGQALRDAVEQVDADTEGAPAYFMINCAYPTHFAHVLEDDGPWLDRIVGLRANASALSHAELDEAEELDEGDPVALAGEYVSLRRVLPRLTVVGGCCGTDHRHVGELGRAWVGAR